MLCHGSHYVGHQVVKVSARSENPNFPHSCQISRGLLRSSNVAQIPRIAQQRKVHRVLDCDELGDVKTLGGVVVDHPPLQHPDDRILEEPHTEVLVHQTFGCHIVTVRYTNSSHLTLTGCIHGHNLKIKTIIIKNQSVASETAESHQQ